VEWERWALHKLALNQFSREQIAAADRHCKRLGELLGAQALGDRGWAIGTTTQAQPTEALEALTPNAYPLTPETEAGHPTTRRGGPA
jgi:hypothetical protein